MDEKRRRAREGLRSYELLPAEVDFESLGLVVKAARELKRMTQAKAAAKAGISAGIWRAIEKGRRIPDDCFHLMASALGGYPDLFARLSKNLPPSRELAKRLIQLELSEAERERRLAALEGKIKPIVARREADLDALRFVETLRDQVAAAGCRLEELRRSNSVMALLAALSLCDVLSSAARGWLESVLEAPATPPA